MSRSGEQYDAGDVTYDARMANARSAVAQLTAELDLLRSGVPEVAAKFQAMAAEATRLKGRVTELECQRDQWDRVATQNSTYHATLLEAMVELKKCPGREALCDHIEVVLERKGG